MKEYILSVVLLICSLSIHAQKTPSNNIDKMENKSTILRLIYPQWQGGGTGTSDFMPDLSSADAARGYYLGSQLLNILAPESDQQTATVPVSLDMNDREIINGINSYTAILRQSKAAFSILERKDPDKIVTLGGDCAVSVVPFTYMAAKYPDDVAIVWIDAHPDINLPGDRYDGYHAMALAACIGLWDDEIIRTLPAKIDIEKVMIVGLRSWDRGIKERQEKLGIKSLAPAQTTDNTNAVLEWLRSTGVSKVVIHFDLDVIDPNEMIAAVGTDPDGMKINEVVRVINDISNEFDLVALTIAEPMPRVAIKIRNMLNQLPLLK